MRASLTLGVATAKLRRDSCAWVPGGPGVSLATIKMKHPPQGQGLSAAGRSTRRRVGPAADVFVTCRFDSVMRVSMLGPRCML